MPDNCLDFLGLEAEAPRPKKRGASAHKGATIIGGNGVRHDQDFYPTPSAVTKALVGWLDWPRAYTVWEPACGQGDMAAELAKHFAIVRSSDIVTGTDFLTIPPIPCDAIITNPPFLLAPQFISRALGQTPYVAMLLKSTFWHAASRTELFRRNPPAAVLALNWRPQFGGEKHAGSSPTMDFIWTVWEPGNSGTRYEILSKG